HFGLLEMSRQRIRSSVLESSTEKCSHCGGTGHVRSVSSVALQLLRSLEEMLLKGATHNLNVRTRSDIALYLLNHKRAHLRVLEERFRIAIMVNADATLGGQLSFVIEKGEQVHSLEQAKAPALQPAGRAAQPSRPRRRELRTGNSAGARVRERHRRSRPGCSDYCGRTAGGTDRRPRSASRAVFRAARRCAAAGRGGATGGATGADRQPRCSRNDGLRTAAPALDRARAGAPGVGR